MKTIWIIDHYSSEPKYGGIARQYDFAKELSKRNYNVVVIASSFSHFTHSYISEEDMYISKIADNAHYVYLKTTSYQKNNSLSRFKNIYSFERAVKKHREKIVDRFGKPDVINGCSVHPLAWVAAQKASKKYNSRLVVEVRDLWPEIWIASNDKPKYHPMVLFFGALEKWAYKKADRIIYSMQNGDKYINGKLGFPKDKMYLIGQPMDTERFDLYKIEKQNLVPQNIQNFMKDSFVATFAGYYMEYEGVLTMLEAAKILKDRNIPAKFVFVGSGEELENMKNYAEKHNLDNILIGDRISKESIPALLYNSDICLAHLAIKGNEKAYQYGVSKNKVNEYLYSGACTLYGFHDKNDPVATSGGGYMIEPFNAHDFADKIEFLYKLDMESLNKHGVNGREYIKATHRVEILVDKLEKVFFDRIEEKI